MTFTRRTLCWLLILVSAAGIVAGHAVINRAERARDDPAALALLNLQGRFLVAGESWAPGTLARELPRLADTARGDGPIRAVAVLYGLLEGEHREDGRNRAADLLRRDSEDRTGRLVERAIAEPSSLEPDERAALERELGWFADMILTRDLPRDDPARIAPRAAAARVLAGMMVLLFLAGGGVLAGCGLLVLAAILRSRTRLPVHFGPPVHDGPRYLEAFTVYIGLFFALEILPGALGWTLPWLSLGGLVLLSLAGLLWPVLAGLPRETAFRDLGLYSGRGVVKEIGCGLAGYVAVLPVVAIGFAVTVALSMLFPMEQASHPVVVWIADGGTATRLAVLFLASVFAPFFEEVLFRGALYRDLRRFLGPLASALIMGGLFAAVHPQGWITVPALAGLAVGFALIREWRGSLIAPMTAHALHNGALVGFMWLAFG